jgi:hypothetical protein
MSNMRVELSPFVASSLLDHAKRTNPARGFLIGSIQHDLVSVHNFVPMTSFPDFFEKPVSKAPGKQSEDSEKAALALQQRRLDERKKQQKTAVELFRQAKFEKKAAVCTFYPHDLNFVGAYAIGDGQSVKVVDRSGVLADQEQTFDVPFDLWAKAPLGEMLGDLQCILVSVTTPSARSKHCSLSWKAELCSAAAVREVPMSIAADSEQTSIVVQTLLRQATGVSPSLVDLDEKLFQEPAGSTATKAVATLKETVAKTAQYAAAVVAGKEKGDKVLAAEFLAKHDELKKARSGALDGTTPHDAVHDALLVKYTVSLLRSQVVAFQTAAGAISQ